MVPSKKQLIVLDAPLLAALAEKFPLRNPQPGDDLPMLMYRAGQRSVIEFLLAQAEEALEPPEADPSED